MDNLESTSDKFKIERLSELVKSLYENIEDLKSQLDKKNITQSNKAFDELYEKHQILEKDYESLDLKFNELFIELDIAEDTIRDKNKKIYELQDSSLRQGYQFNKLTLEYNDKVNTLINERDCYRSFVQTWHDKFNKVEEENKKINELQSENQDLHSSMVKMERESLAKLRENEELKSENERLEVQMNNCNRNFHLSSQNWKTLYDKSLKTAQESYDEVNNKLKESNHLQLTMRTMYENLYDDYRDVKVGLAEFKEYTKDIVEHNKQLRTLVSKLEKEKAILENNAAKHEREVNGLKFKIDFGNFLYNSDHSIMLHYKDKCNEQEKEIENLASTISGMENELNKKDFEIDELSHTIQFASYILKNGGDIPRD